MERLAQRIVTAQRALATLRELAEKATLTAVERDALLQRFEYLVEAVWKAVQLHLREVEGVDVGSPKAAARASLQTGLLSDVQARGALLMIEDPNLTVHTYEERLATMGEQAGRGLLEDRFGDDLVALVVFGSQVTERARPESDLDVVLVIRGLPPGRMDRRRMVRPIIRSVGDGFA